MMIKACVLVAAVLGAVVQILFVKVSLNELYGDANLPSNYKYFSIVQVVSALAAVYGILKKERFFIASYLILQSALFVVCMISLVALEVIGPPSWSIVHPYRGYLMTDKQEILYFLEAQFGVTAGFTLLVFVIVLAYFVEIRREKKELRRSAIFILHRTP